MGFIEQSAHQREKKLNTYSSKTPLDATISKVSQSTYDNSGADSNNEGINLISLDYESAPCVEMLHFHLFIYYIFCRFLGSIDECDDLQVECSSQGSSDSEISDDEQESESEPEADKQDQSERVKFVAALFQKRFAGVKTKPKADTSKMDG